MAGEVELPGGGQAVSPVVPAAADDQRVPPGEPGPDKRADSQGGPLHEHGPRDSDVLDGRPVHLPHLGGRESSGPFEERGWTRAPGPAGRHEIVHLALEIAVGKDRKVVHLGTSPLARDDRQTRSRQTIDMRQRHLDLGHSQFSRPLRGPPAERHPGRASPGKLAQHLDLPPGDDARSQEFTNRFLGREPGGQVQHRLAAGAAVGELRPG